jgi:tRNA nucleotidyltransferase (CCA-adding enzyme)
MSVAPLVHWREMASIAVPPLATFYASLPKETAAILRRAVTLARRQGVQLYAVGGAVRDFLLRAPLTDLDLVVEGDATALARRLGRELGVRVVGHARFGTATVHTGGVHLDFVRARAERHTRPGALPVVRAGSLGDDLARRDFTINAMALRLTAPNAGELIDPFGGREDLSRGLVRVLHTESFRDDPTRALRALRYAGRFGFRLERRTAQLLKRDGHYLDAVSGARLRRELERIAVEERVGRIVRLAHRLGALQALHPALSPGDRALRAIARLPRVSSAPRDEVLCALLLSSAPAKAIERAAERLSLNAAQAAAARGYASLRRHERRLARPSLRASRAVAVLEGYPVAAVEAFALTAEPLAARRARRYLDRWRFVRPELNGRDVQALGVPRGPRIGDALTLLRTAHLDGTARTREDDVKLIERFLRRRRG